MYIVLGLGVSNKAVVKKLDELGYKYFIVLNDDEMSKYGGIYKNVISYDHVKYIDVTKIKHVIKSPGIPHSNKYIKYFKKKNISVINEIELAYILSKYLGKYIGVSGSVGKSSSVSLLYNFIKNNTDNVILAGNIGDPLINYVDIINKDTIIILEVSSFQLDDFVNMRFDIALLLNIYDNHLDFYKNKQNYYLAKFKLTNNQKKSDYFIVNLDNEYTKKYLMSHRYNSRLIDYKTGFVNKQNYIYYYGNKIINLDNYKLLGEHNIDNLKAVIVVLTLLKMNVDANVLSTFKPLSYHLQEKKVKGITVVNDSKSTCVNSLKAAIETYVGRNIILLFGGYNKNLKFELINNYRFKYVICFGKLASEISRLVKYDIKFPSLKEASNFAFSIAKNDDVILFSPGCASFDEFDNYFKRGESFDMYLKDYYHE